MQLQFNPNGISQISCPLNNKYMYLLVIFQITNKKYTPGLFIDLYTLFKSFYAFWREGGGDDASYKK